MWLVIKRAKESKKDVGTVGIQGKGRASKKQERVMQAE
jgi:hypothetical protein